MQTRSESVHGASGTSVEEGMGGGVLKEHGGDRGDSDKGLDD